MASKLSVTISNPSLNPIELHWGWTDSVGNRKTRIELLRDRAINTEISFSCDSEKEAFEKTIKPLCECNRLTLGKQNDKSMQKENEKKNKQNDLKVKSVQKENDKNLQAQVKNITQNEVKDFEVQAVKNQKGE